MYVITTKSRKDPGITLFLIDRTKTKKQWWSAELNNNTLYMRNKRAAVRICTKLKHNNPQVISLEEARSIEKHNNRIYDFIESFHDDNPFQ